MVTQTRLPQLVGPQDCLEILFPNTKSRPGLRTFRRWQARGYIPVHKIGRRTFFDPAQVREALDRRFRVVAGEAPAPASTPASASAAVSASTPVT